MSSPPWQRHPAAIHPHSHHTATQPHSHTATQARMQSLRRPTQRHRARAGPAAGCVRAARWLHGSSCTRQPGCRTGKGAGLEAYRVIVSAEMRRGARESPNTRNASDPDQHPDPEPCSVRVRPTRGGGRTSQSGACRNVVRGRVWGCLRVLRCTNGPAYATAAV